MYRRQFIAELQKHSHCFQASGIEQLHSAVDILWDNAQKYALSPNEVTVQLEKANRHSCRLTVSNQGEPYNYFSGKN